VAAAGTAAGTSAVKIAAGIEYKRMHVRLHVHEANAGIKWPRIENLKYLTGNLGAAIAFCALYSKYVTFCGY